MSKLSFNDREKIVPRYLDLSVYEKNYNSLIIMSAVSVAAVVVFLGGGINIASVFDLPSFFYHHSDLLVQTE